MIQLKREDFFEASVRHWVDGYILEEQSEYDNAVCMQGFAAECALKAILEKGISLGHDVNKIIKNYGHYTDILLHDLEMIGTKIVTFYSFKGGMGRTTALAAVALNMIRHGKNIMMVDTDIEAPGLATLFFDEEVVNAGVLDYLLEHEISASIDIRNYVLDVTDPAVIDETDGNLYLMPAGKVDEYYLQKLARIDYQDNLDNHLRDSIATMLCDIRQNYNIDYILIDARAGFHDLGGVTLSQIPHSVILFGNNSRQSWDGIRQVLLTIAKGHAEDFPVMLVDSMCEKLTSPNFLLMKNQFMQTAYTMFVDCFYDNGSSIPGIEAEGEAHSPEFVYFNDELLQGIELYSHGSQEENARVSAFKGYLTGECYRKLTNRIRRWFGEDEIGY